MDPSFFTLLSLDAAGHHLQGVQASGSMLGKSTFHCFGQLNIPYFFFHIPILPALTFETTALNYLLNSQRQRSLFFLLSNLVFGRSQKC